MGTAKCLRTARQEDRAKALPNDTLADIWHQEIHLLALLAHAVGVEHQIRQLLGTVPHLLCRQVN